MAINGDIEALDFNTLRNKIVEVLGAGSGTYGYGQDIKSNAVFSGDTITKSQWDLLRFDVINARIHQTGVTPSIVTIQNNQLIDDTAADPVKNFNTLIDQIRQDRFDLAVEQSTVSVLDTASYSSAWSNSLIIEGSITFNSATEARYFFNSGGKLQVNVVRTGGSVNPQTNSWNTLLSEVGTAQFGAGTDPNVNFYTLTNDYQDAILRFGSGSYATNAFLLETKCDVADNSEGTATQVQFKISLIDNYPSGRGFIEPPFVPDSIDGTFEITVSTQKAQGFLQPTGTFSVNGPSSFTLGSITAS